jgi:hypothetical protein
MSNGEVQVQAPSSPAADQIADGDTVLINGIQNGYGPIGQNARWMAKCSAMPPAPCSGGTFDLKGSSWTGPSYANSLWKAGTNVIG